MASILDVDEVAVLINDVDRSDHHGLAAVINGHHIVGAGYGTGVKAAAAGTVTTATYCSGGFGNCVFISHGNGYTTVIEGSNPSLKHYSTIN